MSRLITVYCKITHGLEKKKKKKQFFFIYCISCPGLSIPLAEHVSAKIIPSQVSVIDQSLVVAKI